MLTVTLAPEESWYRLADPAWDNPLDPTYARAAGGRWNPPGAFDVLYLNADVATARVNLSLFLEGQPFGPEDLREDTAPILVAVQLPTRQIACDAQSDDGLRAAGLPFSYPMDERGDRVPHAACQPVGERAYGAELDGVYCRCARSPDRSSRELAWFSRGREKNLSSTAGVSFSQWYWR